MAYSSQWWAVPVVGAWLWGRSLWPGTTWAWQLQNTRHAPRVPGPTTTSTTITNSIIIVSPAGRWSHHHTPLNFPLLQRSPSPWWAGLSPLRARSLKTTKISFCKLTSPLPVLPSIVPLLPAPAPHHQVITPLIIEGGMVGTPPHYSIITISTRLQMGALLSLHFTPLPLRPISSRP